MAADARDWAEATALPARLVTLAAADWAADAADWAAEPTDWAALEADEPLGDEHAASARPAMANPAMSFSPTARRTLDLPFPSWTGASSDPTRGYAGRARACPLCNRIVDQPPGMPDCFRKIRGLVGNGP